MKKFLALFAVVASFALASPAFAQHHGQFQNGGPRSIHPGVNPGFRSDYRNPGSQPNFYQGRQQDFRRDFRPNVRQDFRHDYRFDNRRDYRYDNRNNYRYDNRDYRYRNGYRGLSPWLVLPFVAGGSYYYYDRPSYQEPYTYYDNSGREVYVDQYGRRTFTGYYRRGGDCGSCGY